MLTKLFILGLIPALTVGLLAACTGENPMTTSEAKWLEMQEGMDQSFQELLNYAGETSFYSIPQEKVMAFLAKRGDLYCEDDRCCGGNTIGWYSCFYKK